jgi:hypothetical protein
MADEPMKNLALFKMTEEDGDGRVNVQIEQIAADCG